MTRQRGIHSTSAQRLLGLSLLLLAFALRCSGLDAQELRGDEAFGYFFSLNAPGEIVEQTLDLREPHPVASYWMQHFWLQVAGDHESALRFLGVWWSVIAVALLRPLASQLGLSTWTGLVAMLLMAMSPYAIWHAKDARMYSMSLALTMASTYCAAAWWRASHRSAQTWLAFAYIVVTWLALQTHYFALYIVAAQHLALLGWAGVTRRWGRLLRWWLVSCGVLLLWLPWLWAARDILTGYVGNGDSPGLLEALVRVHAAFGAGESVGGALRVAAGLLVLGGIGLGLWALGRSEKANARQVQWFLVVYWLTPLLATWISALNRPIFNERYLVAAVPPVYLLLAAAVELPRNQATAWRRWWVPGLLVAVMTMMLFGLVRQGSDTDFSKSRGWRELATSLAQMSTGVDPARVRLVQNYPDPTLWYYYRGDVAHLVLPPVANDAQAALREVAQLADAGVGRILLVEQPADAWDGQAVARSALQTRYQYGGETIVAAWPVSIWLRPTEPMSTISIDYETGLRLVETLVTPRAATPGAIVEVHLTWSAEAGAVEAQEAVSIQLLNGSGTLVAQSDRPLATAGDSTALQTSYAILLPDDLSPSEYTLVVVVYDPGQEGSPRRRTHSGDEVVNLGTVTVTFSGQSDSMDGR